MSSLAVLSFVAGILSILAPCILPVLPVILGGSLGTNNLSKPLTIIVSTAVSITLFTIVLKVSTVFIDISPSVWSTISATIIIIYGLTLVAPHQREQVSISLGLYKINNLTSIAQKYDGVLGNILLGASLGPIFTSCSPTYTLLLSTIFPSSFIQGVIYTCIYSLGFALALFAVAYGGRAVTNHLSHLANPMSRFKKTLGIILVITGMLIATGYMKQIESAFIDYGRTGIGTIEQTLLNTTAIEQNGEGMQNTGRYLDYTATDISSLTGDIVLFFHADRCPTCRQAEKSFLENGIPTGLTIIKVDYDTNHELRKKYTVLSQTSYVYIKPDGTLIKRRVGGTNIGDITSKLEEIKGNTQSTKSTRVGSGQIATAHLAGGCFWCLEGPFESLEGVKQVTNGYIGGSASDARYDIIGQGNTKHREVVQVEYDPALISYGELLETYWRQIDPTDSGGQFADRGYQYTTAIYYNNDQEKQIATIAKNNLETSKKFTKPIAVQIIPATQFYPAEEYHQDYYKKNSSDYQRYKKGSGREDYITTNWKNIKTATTIVPRQDRPPKSVSDLSDIQRNILFEGGTEPPFDNPYWDNHEAGIYVDVIDGTPLFSSLDKFDSGTGRPSFTKPIDQSMIGSHTDTSLGITRTEIKSSSSNGHLGHVFDDGPAESGGARYCINSAALEFIPLDQLEIRGYGEYKKLFTN